MNDQESDRFVREKSDGVAQDWSSVRAARMYRVGTDEDGQHYECVFAFESHETSDFVRVYANGRHILSLVPMRGEGREAISVIPIVAGEDEGSCQILVYPDKYVIEMDSSLGTLEEFEDFWVYTQEG